MKIKFTLLQLFFSFLIFAQNEFITLWKPSNPSTFTSNNQINFPGFGTNYNIYWEEVGDSNHNGTINNVTTKPLDAYSFKAELIDFGNSQNPDPLYMVKVSNGSGNFSAIDFRNQIGADRMKIIDVKQWGNIKWKIRQNPGITVLNGGFYDCQNLDITATDLPDFSLNTSLLEMFYHCKSLKGNSSFSSWDTSTINDMQGMFQGATLFNADIGQWNTSKVTKMFAMFYNAENFNQNIGNWDTSKVWHMDGMFVNAKKFNQNIGNWNTSNVIRMFQMFRGASNFNQDIANWDVSKVELFTNFFLDATSFNQNLANWNIRSAVTTGFSHFFDNSNLSCENYNETLIGWSNNPATANNLNFTDNKNMIYSSPEAVTARNYLINTKGWTISGDVYSPTCALSTNDLSLNKIQIYPIPAKETIYIRTKISGELDYKITDFSGRLILKGKSFDKKINIQTLKTGNYILVLTDKNSERLVQKFIKQ